MGAMQDFANDPEREAENARLKKELIDAGLFDMITPTGPAEARALQRLAELSRERIARLFALPSKLVIGRPLSPSKLQAMAEHREFASLRAMGFTGTLVEMRVQERAQQEAMWAEITRRALMTPAERAIEDRHRRLTWNATFYLPTRAAEYALLPRRERKRIERIMGRGLPSRCRVIRAERARILYEQWITR